MPYTNTKHHNLYYLSVERHRFAMPHQAKGITLSKAIEGFMLACQARQLSKHTITDYSRTLNRFVGHVGDSLLNQITTTQVNAFLASQPFSAKTVLNYHIGLSALWTWAIKEGYTDRHILRMVDRPRPQKIAVVPFTEVEIKAILGAVRRNADRDKAIIMLLLDTGMRASELCSLAMEKINLATRSVLVLGKGNKERSLPISARTASALFKYISTVDNISEPFPFTRTSLAHLVRKIGDRAGVKDCHPHRFRHTFAITYLRNGGDPYTLQEILGHTTMEMVKTYLAIAQVDVNAVHKRASPVENWKL